MKQLFESFEILKTYIYYDEPLTFSCNLNGELYLSHSWDFDPVLGATYAFFKTTTEQLLLLEEDKITLRQYFKERSSENPAYVVLYNKREAADIQSKKWDTLEESCYVKDGIYLNKDDDCPPSCGC